MLKGNSVVTSTTHTQSVATLSDGRVVGHMPRKISPVCSIFIRRGGSITCTVSDRRRYSADLEQGGLEIPCKIKSSTSSSVEKEKVEKLVTAALSNNETTQFLTLITIIDTHSFTDCLDFGMPSLLLIYIYLSPPSKSNSKNTFGIILYQTLIMKIHVLFIYYVLVTSAIIFLL